jgi:nucleoside-diphosphate-sugar epimerase
LKILLTGGTGYLGTHLLKGLLEAGHQITVLTRHPREEGAGSQLRWLRGDLRDGPPAREVLHKHRAVIHTAAMVKSWSRDRSEFDRVNVEAYAELLERCSQVGVSKILHTSSFLSLGPSRNGSPLTESDRTERDRFYTDYERTKFLADRETDRWVSRGLPVISLHPTVLLGPGAITDGNLVGKMIYWIAQDRFPGMIGSGDQIWNYAYVLDVVQGHLKALERGLPGERYILGGENVALRSVLAEVHRILSKPFRVRQIPIPMAEFLGRLMELWAGVKGRPPDLTRGIAGVYREHWSYSSQKAIRRLGYQITPFPIALEETVRWASKLERWVA